MQLLDVVAVSEALSSAGIDHWLGGGWGVDALVGRQTRPHRDLDLAVDSLRLGDALAQLATLGYHPETDWLPVRVELAGTGQRWVDLHPVTFDEQGNGRQAGPDGQHFDYPAADLVVGAVEGRRLPCLSVGRQRLFHSGYPLRPQDEADLAQLDRLEQTSPVVSGPDPGKGAAMWAPRGVPFGGLMSLSMSAVSAAIPSRSAQPPVAQQRPILRSHHGDTFSDPYEWLRDKEDPEVIAYLESENRYTEARTGHLEDLTEAVFSEIKARTKETDLSVPSYASHRGGSAYWYYSRTVAGSEYPIFCRVAAQDRSTPPDPEAEIIGEQVLLDGNLEAEGHAFFSLGAFSMSENGRLLAYSVDTTGGERFTLRVRDLDTGRPLADEIEDTAYGVAWAGNDHLFYTRADEAWRPYVVLRHRLGADPAADVEVLTEADERFWVGVDTSRDDRWVVIGLGSKLTSEYHLLSTDDPEGMPRVVAPRREGVEYDVEPAGDRLLIVHNDGAEDFALAQAPLTASSHEEWQPVLAHSPGVRLLGVSAYAGHAVVSLRRDGLTGLHVLPRDHAGDLGAGADIEFTEALRVVDAPGESEYETPTIRVNYASMLTPDSVFDYDLSTGELTLLKRTPVLDDPTYGPYRPENYVQERGWATAPDGTLVPLSIVRRTDVALDGTAPALLYGYGSYEISVDPAFSLSRLSLLDRGVVYAIAHVRGGGELGRGWYENGKTLTKQNTFTDFVACADYLLEHGYTSPDRLAARGASAGGLLMGAVANLAPERFRAIHAGVPFVDALTTILDPELPLTVIEWDEWGDPLHDPAVYAYMKSYTPYENLSPQTYPAILATTSLNDTRVFFVEPAKWVAALRQTATNPEDRPILLKTEMVAGHGGVSGRYKSWRETAFEYAWILDQILG